MCVPKCLSCFVQFVLFLCVVVRLFEGIVVRFVYTFKDVAPLEVATQQLPDRCWEFPPHRAL